MREEDYADVPDEVMAEYFAERYRRRGKGGLFLWNRRRADKKGVCRFRNKRTLLRGDSQGGGNNRESERRKAMIVIIANDKAREWLRKIHTNVRCSRCAYCGVMRYVNK